MQFTLLHRTPVSAQRAVTPVRRHESWRKDFGCAGGHAGLSQTEPGQEPEVEEPAAQQAEDGALLSRILQPTGPDRRFSKEGRPNSKPCNVLVQVRDDIFEDFMVFLRESLEYLLKGV